MSGGCTGFFLHTFSFTYNVPHFCCWKLVDVLNRGLIDSAAESANYMSTRDNLMVGVMSRCKSNKSQFQSCHYGHPIINYSWVELAWFAIQGSPTIYYVSFSHHQKKIYWRTTRYSTPQIYAQPLSVQVWRSFDSYFAAYGNAHVQQYIIFEHAQWSALCSRPRDHRLKIRCWLLWSLFCCVWWVFRMLYHECNSHILMFFAFLYSL